MRNVFIISLVVNLCLFSCDTPQNITPNQEKSFFKLFGGGFDQEGYDLKQTPDGGFILVGSTTSQSSGTESDLFIIKTDIKGNEVWSKNFGSTGNDLGKSVQVLSDGYIFCGNYTQNDGNTDLYVLRTDLEGNEIWSQIIGTDSTNESGNTVRVYDEGFIVVGKTTNLSQVVDLDDDPCDIFIVKLDFNGNYESNEMAVLGLKEEDEGIDIYPTADGFIVLSTSNLFGSGLAGKNYLISSLTPNLIPYNHQSFGNSEENNATQLAKIGTEEWVIAGTSGDSDSRIQLVKIDNSQSEVWNKVIQTEFATSASSIYPISDGLLIAGTSINNEGDMSITKANLEGEILWAKEYGGFGIDRVGKIIQSSDEGIVFIGTLTFGENTMISLIKVDPEGDLNIN